jgi:galactonate dehydratase
MRISRIETFLVPPRWLFCRVETDDGVVGWGEPVVEGRAATVRAAVHELAEYLIGQDPLRVEDHWQVLTRGGFYRGGPVLSSAVAGLDQALWDIAGRARGLPVHELLGGPLRDSVRVYGWIGGDEPAEVADAAAAQVANGLTAVKMTASGKLPRLASVADVQAVVDRVAAVREVIGPHRDVAIDVHGRATAATARQLIAALTDLHPLFIEEPLLPEHGHLLPGLVASTSVPIATGERLYSRSDFLPVLQAGIAVAQPDLSHASLQVDLLSPNFLIQEQSLGIHYNEGSDLLDYLVDRSVFDFAEGAVRRPLGPGLGVAVDESAVRAADRVGHAWRSPVWRHADGSLAEW